MTGSSRKVTLWILLCYDWKKLEAAAQLNSWQTVYLQWILDIKYPLNKTKNSRGLVYIVLCVKCKQNTKQHSVPLLLNSGHLSKTKLLSSTVQHHWVHFHFAIILYNWCWQLTVTSHLFLSVFIYLYISMYRSQTLTQPTTLNLD